MRLHGGSDRGLGNIPDVGMGMTLLKFGMVGRMFPLKVYAALAW